jgi:hypothetical protein
MRDQDRFSDHAAKLAGLRQPHHSDDQMKQNNEEVAHSDNRNKVRQPSDFTPTLEFARDITQNEVACLGADKWTPFQRMTIDLGLRFDYDSITHATNTTPRAG